MPVVNTDRKYKEKYKHTIKRKSSNHKTIKEENKRRQAQRTKNMKKKLAKWQ